MLVSSDADISFTEEFGLDLISLADTLFGISAPEPIQRKFASALNWLCREYVTYIREGEYAVNEFHAMAVACKIGRAMYARSLWCLTPFDYGILGPKDSLVFQYYWLHEVANADDGRQDEDPPRFCKWYMGDFHYELPFEFDGRLTTISPLNLALRSRIAFGKFLCILSGIRIDLAKFAEQESKMPWCTYTWEMLDCFLSVNAQIHKVMSPMSAEGRLCCRCYKWLRNEANIDWQEMVKLFRSGEWIASLSRSSAEEQRQKLFMVWEHCELCKVGNFGIGERKSFRFVWEEDIDEDMELY
jgi:hypothetical protein